MTQPILSADQNHLLHHTFFVPKGKLRGCLLVVHGMSEHSGRYADFAQFLAQRGILVLTFDLLGHGKTVKDRYELGFFDKRHPVQILSKDVMAMTDALKEKAKSLSLQPVPCVIMGHSMGSFLVRTVLIHHATSFDGVILMGSGQLPAWQFGLSRHALFMLNLYRPKSPNPQLAKALNHWLLLSSKLKNTVKNKLSKSPAPTPSDSPFAWLSENPDNIKAFESDPLTGFALSNNGFYTLHALFSKASTSAWYRYLHAPVLLISGANDPVGGHGKDIKTLHRQLERAGKKASLILYPNMRHEPLHENDKMQVYSDILAFILSL